MSPCGRCIKVYLDELLKYIKTVVKPTWSRSDYCGNIVVTTTGLSDQGFIQWVKYKNEV